MAGSKSLGRLVVDLDARVSGWSAGMSKAGRDAEKFEKQMKARAKSIDDQVKFLGDGIANTFKVGFAAASAAVAASTAAIAASINDVAQSYNDLRIASELSGASVQTLQEWGAGASLVGIEVEKLGDIFKDVGDRIGDFASTGGGPLADFFEQIGPKVGVTIEDFKRLSGPEALQLFYDSLEKAGANANDMKFYMESLAGDASRLIPLLADGGAELDAWASAASNAGAIISDELVGSLEQYRETSAQFDLTMQGVKNTISEAVIPALTLAKQAMIDWWKEGDNSRKVSEFLIKTLDFLYDTVQRVIIIYNQFKIAIAQIDGFMNALIESIVSTVNQMANLGRTVGSVIVAITTGQINKIPDLIKGGFNRAKQEFKRGTSNLEAIAIDMNRKIEASVKASADAQERIGKSPLKAMRTMNEVLGEQKRLTDEVARSETKLGLIRQEEEKKDKKTGGVSARSGGGGRSRAVSSVDASQRQAEREAEQRAREIERQIQEAQRAREQFDKLAATLAGPLAAAHHQYKQDMAELNELAKAGGIETDRLTTAQKQLTEAYHKDIEAIKERMDPAQRVLQDLQFEIFLLGKTREEQERLTLARQLDGSASRDAAVEALAQLQHAEKVMSQQIEVADTIRDSFSGAFQDWVSGSKSFKDAFLGALDSINARILQMISDNLVEKLFGGFGSQMGGALGGGSGGGGGFWGWLGGLFAGGKASGGWAMPDSVYRVNEVGPEFFSAGGKDYMYTGRTGVNVTPHHKIGGNAFSQTNNFLLQGRIDRRTESQIAMQTGRKAQEAQRRYS